MSLTAAEQAIVDHLAAEPGPVTWASPGSPGGWVASVRSGGGEGADPATVRFRKSRTFAGCQLHEVEYATRNGCPQRMLVRTWQKPGGSWVADPIGGGGGRDPLPAQALVQLRRAVDHGSVRSGRPCDRRRL